MKNRMEDAGPVAECVLVRGGVVRGCVRRGVTRTDVLAVMAMVAVLLMLAVVLLPLLGGRGHHGPRRGTVSSTHLKDMHIAMYQYSVMYKDKFPIAGAADVESDVFGFAGGNRGTGEGAVLDNNVTASLWIGIREGALTPEQFVNPNVMTAEMDEVTLDGRPGTRQLQVREVYDFARAENLSYSVMNMYHEAVGQNWSAVVHPEYVMMGDNNNSDWLGSPGRHTNTSDTGLTDQQVMDAENSRNHGGEGQNFMFGDGHVAWHTDPFVGIGNDNVYAQDMAAGSDSDPFPDEVAAPPTLGNQRDDPDTYTRNVRERDSFLLPITGNGGGAGSLDPLD